MPRFPGFIGATGVAQSLIADAEDTRNWYVERGQQPTLKSPMALFPSPGFLPVGMVQPDVTGRAACFAGGRLFFVVGGGFYEWMMNATYVQRGSLAQDGNPAQAFYNGQVGGQVGIASGGNFYTFILATNVFAQQLTGVCTQTEYAGGYFFAFNLNTGQVLVSALNDGTTWNNGIFFQRSLFPDPWQALFVDSNNLLWLIGSETFEVWYNTGTGTQPWAPLIGLSGFYGIAAPFAFWKSAAGNGWLAANKQGVGPLVLTKGSGQAQPIPSYAFSTAIAAYLRTNPLATSTAEAWAYQQEGHDFAIITFPNVPDTWCYDIEGNSFTRRGTWNPVTGLFDAWSPRIHVPAWGQHLVMNRTSGVVCAMDTFYTTEFDGVTGIVRERTTPGMTEEHQRKPIDQFELLMDVGLASQAGQGSNPQATLRISADGGRTYGNERTASLGRVGQYRRRVYWSQLGAPVDCVLRVRTSDPAPSRIVDAWLNNQEQAA